MVTEPKPFTHHDKWFMVLDRLDPHWPDDKHVLHLPERLIGHAWFYHWIESERKLYRISYENTVKYRRIYNHRWHISKQYLEEIQMPRGWEHWIKDYVRHPEVEAQPDLFKPSGN